MVRQFGLEIAFLGLPPVHADDVALAGSLLGVVAEALQIDGRPE